MLYLIKLSAGKGFYIEAITCGFSRQNFLFFKFGKKLKWVTTSAKVC